MTFSELGIDLPDVFQGDQYTQCPKCSPTRKKKKVKCLSANSEKGVFNCHHCGWSGNTKTGTQSKGDPNAWKRKEYRRPTFKRNKLPIDILSWFKNRGISEETLVRNNISYGRTYMPQPEDFVPAIQFPYKKDGKVVNVKYRDLKKNWRQEVGAESIVYKFDDLKNLSELIICEGEIDALSFDEIGLTAVSVPNGAPAPNAKNYESEFGYLEALKDMIGSCDKVLLAVDDDEAGQKLESELCRRIGKEKCWRLFYPPGCKDANEILSKHGQEGLQKAYDGSEPYPLDGIISIKGMRKDTENLYDHGYDRGHSTGWASLNDYYRVREGEFTVVTGVPSHGKSTWLDHLMVNMAVRDDWKFAVFTPENLPLHKHLAGLLEKYIQKPFDKGYQERMDREELDRALAWAQEHFMYIFPTKDTVHVDDVLELAKACVYRDGVKGIVLDPWNEMEHSRSGSVTETEFVSEVLSKVRRFSRLREVHFWIVAHPTKLRKVMEDGKLRYPIPTPYDISGSAHWRNKADNCITVWRDLNSKDSLVEIHIQKIRFKEMGKPGKVVLKWSRPTGCFVDLEK